MTAMLQQRLGLAASVSALTLASSLALGAPSAQAAAAPAVTGDASTVGEVVVTAERRRQNLQTAPLAATAIAGAELQRKGIVTVDALQFTTPALTVNNFGQGNDFNIRGVGKGETNVQTPSGVITYRDGVATFPGFFQDEPYYDESSVEVLRGPQGTFSGQNATGGAVYITSNDPSLASGYHGDAQIQYGNYNDIQVRGALNIPISDTFAARIAINDEYHDSFYNITGNHTGHPGLLKEYNARIGLLWQPNSQLKVLLKADYSYVDQGGYPAGPNRTDLFNLSNNARNVALDKFYRISLNISYELPDGITLRSISGYQYGFTQQDVDLDGTDLAPLTFTDYATEEIYSEELNLVSPDTGPLRWVVGGYFQHDVVTIPAGGFDIGLPMGGFDIDLTYRTPKQTEAVFGQATYDLTSSLQLQGGLRYAYSTFDLADDNFDAVGGAPLPGVLATGHTSDSKVTGKIDLNWKLDENNFLYAFVATGHKTGGINTSFVRPGQTVLDPISPEDVTDYEVGWKPTFFDGHMRLQTDFFYSIYHDFQFTYTAGTSASEVLNNPAATDLYGVEIEGQAVFGHLSFDFGGAYLHTSLGSFVTGDPNSGTPQDIGGNRQPNAPRFTFNLGARYAFTLPNDATLTPSVQYGYVGDQWTTVFQKDPADAANHLAQRNLVNAQLTYDAGPYEIAAYVTNLGDLHYVAAANVGLFYAGAPRQFGLRLKRSF